MNNLSYRSFASFVAAGLAAIAATAQADDTTPPTLSAPYTWIEKVSNHYRFNVLLDPHDNQGIQRLEVREKINTTTMPATEPWREAIQDGIGSYDVPWKPAEPLTLEFSCSSMVLQVRAVDTSGNYSEVITRTYKSPFPISAAPNLTPVFGSTPISLTGSSALDCRAVFAADFDGDGRDDLVAFDRASGKILIKRQNFGDFITDTVSVTPGSLSDGAVGDFNGDGRTDLAVVVDDSVTVFFNDGLDVGNALQFTPLTPAGLPSSGMSVVRHILAADITGEGKPDLVISGSGDGSLGGSGGNVAVLINNEQYQFGAANNAPAPTGLGDGRMAAADFDGDGWNDLVMVDSPNKKIILFKNLGNGSFGAPDNPDASKQPVIMASGLSGIGSAANPPSYALTPKAVAVGDVTGDGKPDIVVTTRGYLGTGNYPDIVYRNVQLWQLFENRGDAGFQRWYSYDISQSAEAAGEEDFESDVLLEDLNGDRLPELVFTRAFDGGIRAYQFKPWLDRQNQLNQFDFTPVDIGGTANPQRLASARFGANKKRDIVVANGSATQLDWWFTIPSVTSSKPVDVIGAVSPQSDPNGGEGYNGTRSYGEYVGGVLDYSLSYLNNSSSDIVGATLECVLPIGVELITADDGHTTATIGKATAVRWSLDIPKGTSGVKNFSVRLAAVKAGSSVAPKNTLKRGTTSLASGTMPPVKVLNADFTAFPNTFGQTWGFSYKPATVPSGNSLILVQASPDGNVWSDLSAPAMTRAGPTSGEWIVSTSAVPGGSRYFRAKISDFGEDDAFSSVFTTFLPPTTALKITTKKPYRSGNVWTLSATQSTTAANASLRFQSTETPADEGSWTDLPIYEAVKRAGNVWTSVTYNVPSGPIYFRAIAAAPGWVDSISSPSALYEVQATAPALPPFTHYHVDFKDPATYGQPAAFMATCGSVPGLKVRFQTRLYGEGDEAWQDLTDGTTSVAGTKWTFKTNYMPVGDREWRPIASAPGYLDNTTAADGSEVLYRWEVLPAPLPQIPTIFAPFEHPADGSLQITGVDFPISIDLFDFNGAQRVYLEAAKPGAAFKEVAGTDMTNTGGVTYATTVRFTGMGQLMLRVAVVDGYSPSQICRSDAVTITVGPGGGSSGPTIGAFANSFTQATLKARGAVKVKTRIGDDKQVYRAYLHRLNANGDYLSTAGEMVRSSAANPSDFSFTDANLSDGAYYYRVVASDYDGNETISGSTSAYVVTTPAPPPSPITLDIAATSRLVLPTLPSTKFNYTYIPYAESGMIEFSYNGLPTGTNRFVAYREDLGPNRPYWEQTVTKTSGTLKIKAPYWTANSSYPSAGEGTYRITCFQGSVEIPHGSGHDEFVVGHAWNLPNTFTSLDYGLYWFKDARNGLRGIENQNDEYFDPNKPTVIYVHGWQPGEVKVKRRESWLRQDPYKDATVYDMCKIWKSQGYNVGMFNWNQFADGDLLFSQANIYYRATESGLPDDHSLIFSTLNPDGSSSRHYYASGSGGDIEGKTVCDILIQELYRCLGNYSPSPSKEFRLFGHSLGTQVVGRTCDIIRTHPDWGIPLPTRISLLELAQINGLDPTGLDIPALQKGFITGLVNKGIAIDTYQSTDLQSLLGVNLAFVGDIHDMTAYARWRPDFIQPVKVGLDVFQKSHNEIVRWYMQSFDYNEFPAFTYWAPFVKRDAVGNALSASTSNTRVKALMGGIYWFEQSEGKNTATIADDQFERKTR